VLFDTNVVLDVLLARASAAAAIVTRNVPDFGKATVPVLTPQELLAAVVASTESVLPE
jgi:hypothetical protein